MTTAFVINAVNPGQGYEEKSPLNGTLWTFVCSLATYLRWPAVNWTLTGLCYVTRCARGFRK